MIFPLLHSQSCLCLSPDIVFFIYLYQRWIYRVDPKRVNEFGTSGEDEIQGRGAVVTISQAPQQPNGPSTDGEVQEKSAEDKKND